MVIRQVNRLSIIADTVFRADHISEQLAGVFETQVFCIDEIVYREPTEFTVGDLNLDGPHIPDFKLWLKRRPKRGKVILLVDKASRFQSVQAQAIGATDLLPRPIDAKSLVRLLLGDIQSLAGGSDFSIDDSHGVAAGVKALQNVFASASLGKPLDQKSINAAGETIVSNIEEDGFGRWIDTVRKHHSQTYQHCLIVTGAAVTFGQHRASLMQTSSGWRPRDCCMISAKPEFPLPYWRSPARSMRMSSLSCDSIRCSGLRR